METGIGGGEVLGVVPVKTILVKYRDGRSDKEEVKLAAVFPDGQLYFFGKDALDLRPAQGWLKAGVTAKMAPPTTTVGEDPTQV